ncbi:MAG: GAF domain-containing sensor histidine kinase [Haloferacaceae archaeon]
MSGSEGRRADDVTDLSGEAALRRMYRITADHDRPFEAKLDDLLDLGRAYLGVDVAYLTEIADGTQSIVAAAGDHELLRPGLSCPLSEAYCRKTIDRADALTVQHAAIEDWENDAAYERFGLESYIGAKVVVDGEIDGTFCFADTDPRDEPFTEGEVTFVELMAEWAGYELFRDRATERIERQRDRLEEFAGVVSHDLRNPLGIVRGYLDLAEETGDPEHFDRCHDALDRMEMLIDDLLALAREGEEVVDAESVSLADLAEDSWAFVDTADATLRVGTDRVVAGEANRLRQLFENLFRNAVEHGGGSVTVRVGDLPDGFYVEDDGPGIPADERGRIFEEGHSTTDGGTGFGLTIVERVADAHGWSVRAAEGSDGGARFEITGLGGGDR